LKKLRLRDSDIWKWWIWVLQEFDFWDPKSRSVNIFSQRSDFGLLGLIWDKFSLV
jgi:hypothetical protein